MAAALKLGETLVKAAFTAITGQPIAGDMAAGLASVLGDNALGKVDARRASRLMTDIADTAAEHIAGAYEHEFRGLSESERAVINAVADTFARVPTTEMAFAADFDARKFEQHVRNLTSEYLRSWYQNRWTGALQPDTPAVLCVEVIGIVRGLSDLANRAVPEVLTRLTSLSRDVWEAPRRALSEAAQDADSAFADLYQSWLDSSMDMIKLDSAGFFESS